MKKDVLYFSHPQIVFQEVPDEISLAVSISGCKMKCNDCHSSFTWDKKYGKELSDKKINYLIKRNEHISCVLFYGGEWNCERLIELLCIVKNHNLKTCLYTGLEFEQVGQKILKNLDFIKTGRFIKELGGLSSKTTNQKFFRLNPFENITNYFCNKFNKA